VKTATSILISSDFLQMAGLVEESLTFASKNLQDIILLPIDMSCLNSALVKRLAAKVDEEALEQLNDRKDKLRSKLYMKKLELLFEQKHNMLHRCLNCNQLFTRAQREWQQCEKGTLFTDATGKLSVKHVADEDFELNKFVISLRSKKLAWRDLFWKLYACVLEFKCATCNTRFTGNKLNHCNSHSLKPFFTFGENVGFYPCCNGKVLRFDSGIG
jgi:hypothetical protein